MPMFQQTVHNSAMLSNLKLQRNKFKKTNNIQFPEHVLNKIQLIKTVRYNLKQNIISALQAFIAEYIVLTIQERVSCATCLDPLSTSDTTNPLPGLIQNQYRGGLKNPTKEFACLISHRDELVVDIIQYLPMSCNPSKILYELLLDYFKCFKLLHMWKSRSQKNNFPNHSFQIIASTTK